MDGACHDLINNQHYLFAEEFLMPESYIKVESCESLLDIEQIAVKYSVSPSAVVMRMFRLGKISVATKALYLTTLFELWSAQSKRKGGGNKLDSNTAIARYNNRAVVSTLVKKYETKALNENEFRNLLCLKKGEHIDLEAIRNA